MCISARISVAIASLRFEVTAAQFLAERIISFRITNIHSKRKIRFSFISGKQFKFNRRFCGFSSTNKSILPISSWHQPSQFPFFIEIDNEIEVQWNAHQKYCFSILFSPPHPYISVILRIIKYFYRFFSPHLWNFIGPSSKLSRKLNKMLFVTKIVLDFIWSEFSDAPNDHWLLWYNEKDWFHGIF